MYQEKMAFAVKVNGRVLRESQETVLLPFGTEYTLLIKNMNNRRAVVRITIDGKEAVYGGLVVNANSTTELERFVEYNQMDKGLRFKFIERTGKVEQHRGVGVEDGLIRVEFEYERSAPPKWGGYIAPNTYEQLGNYNGGLYQKRTLNRGIGSNGMLDNVLCSSSYSNGCGAAAAASSESYDWMATEMHREIIVDVPKNDAGITVGGSVSEQKFTLVDFTGDGKTHVMIMKLRGDVNDAPVEKPITVDMKKECPTCGTENKGNAKYCIECGTGLELTNPKQLPARFTIGDWVVCKGYKHQVKGVRFTESKVYYSLAFHSNLDGELIEYASEDVYALRDFEKGAAEQMELI